ncbi:hypothetical protein FNV43_RR24624 [Rhamnella rubrinervis]|uniref:Uncharacterized protein n=1 Tax=Rhamnella rubrinervis TaxID=2594499 RepID=A0A8K0DYG2_9ROSA|nr:hypothetical protein FNV43_RR24624 [Rhamnella rubrinervis]
MASSASPPRPLEVWPRVSFTMNKEGTLGQLAGGLGKMAELDSKNVSMRIILEGTEEIAYLTSMSNLPSVLKFKLNGVDGRFDRKAFLMIMGLNCGKFPPEVKMKNLSYNLWTKYFGQADGASLGQSRAPSSVVPELEQELVHTILTSMQFQPEGAHSQHLRSMMDKLRNDFTNKQVDFEL